MKDGKFTEASNYVLVRPNYTFDVNLLKEYITKYNKRNRWIIKRRAHA